VVEIGYLDLAHRQGSPPWSGFGRHLTNLWWVPGGSFSRICWNWVNVKDISVNVI